VKSDDGTRTLHGGAVISFQHLTSPSPSRAAARCWSRPILYLPDRELRATLFPFLDAVERDVAEVPLLLRVGFLAALRVGFLAPAAALIVFRFVVFVDDFFAAEACFDDFFFGDADAGFTFRFGPLVRFLAAPMAAPESAPITVPTTGTPRAVPATAPATAPPRALPAEPLAASAKSSSLFLSSMFLSLS
jgi:hypothetical protein